MPVRRLGFSYFTWALALSLGCATDGGSTDGLGGGASSDGSGGDPSSSGAAPGSPASGGSSNGSGGASSGGSGGLQASGGGTSPPEYQPCPALPEPCKIMASGDSITVGAQSTETGGYRVPLFRKALLAGQHMTFVGPSGAGPAEVESVPFPDSHDGHSGYVIEPLGGRKGLLPLIPANTSKFTPHIVLLHIGTNDLNSELEVASAPQRLARVIDAFLIGAPDALLVVAQLIPTRTDSLNDAVETYNAATAELVAARVASGKHIVLVDHYSAFQEHPKYRTDYLFDGLHPNDAGYAAMADVWYGAISRFLR